MCGCVASAIEIGVTPNAYKSRFGRGQKVSFVGVDVLNGRPLRDERKMKAVLLEYWMFKDQQREKWSE